MIKIGDKVSNFKLKNQNGNDFELSEHLGKGKIVLYFYLKDEAKECKKEACIFRDRYEEFVDTGVKVVGISSDNVESHKQFAEKNNLPFTLLSDEKDEIRKLFGVPKTLGLLPGRVTFVMDENGIIISIFNSQLFIDKHINSALEIIRANKNGK